MGEDVNEIVTEIESRNVIFLEKDFHKRGEIKGDFQLYEMEYPEKSGSTRHIDSAPTKQDDMGYHAAPKVSGSKKLSDFSHMEQDHEQSQPRHSNRDKNPRLQFEIEGEAFMIAYDEEEQKTTQQAFSGPKSNKWIKVMEEDMNSMKSN